MHPIYREDADRRLVQGWCADRLDAWETAHERLTLDTRLGPTHLLRAGDGPGTVVLVPGTNFNAATSLPLVAALAARWTTYVPDVPGQPGLSAPARPGGRGRTEAYGGWLGEVLSRAVDGPVVLLGHSLGGAVALACDVPQLTGRVLVSTAGLSRLGLSGPLLAATVPWLLRPTDDRSARLLTQMSAPGAAPAPELAHWMTLVARHCRSSLAPPPLPEGVLTAARRVPNLVATGEHDVFLPPSRLAPAAQNRLDVPLRTLAGAGHLVPEQSPATVAALVAEHLAD